MHQQPYIRHQTPIKLMKTINTSFVVFYLHDGAEQYREMNSDKSNAMEMRGTNFLQKCMFLSCISDIYFNPSLPVPPWINQLKSNPGS